MKATSSFVFGADVERRTDHAGIAETHRFVQVVDLVLVRVLLLLLLLLLLQWRVAVSMIRRQTTRSLAFVQTE